MNEKQKNESTHAPLINISTLLNISIGLIFSSSKRITLGKI